MTEAGKLRRSVYIVSFSYSVQFGLLLFFNSSFLLDRGFTDQGIGLVFAAGYALAILLLLLIPRLLPLFGDRYLFTGGLLFASVLFFAIASSTGLAPVAVMLPVALALSMAMYVLLDILLQTVSADPDKIGGRRGLMATLTNGAYIVAQFLAVFLLARGPFSILYTVTAAMLIPLAALGFILFRRFRDAAYEKPRFGGVFRHLAESADLRRVFMIQFLLRLFYSIMIVYTPVYLHEHVGLTLAEMGTVFAVMLLPFLLFEVLIGKLEDTRWGEQEVLLAGFVIIAASTAAIAATDSTSVLVWGAALFMTRVGAVCLDIGSEAYFFKHVTGKEAGEVSSFRMLYPAAYIVGPLTAVGLLFILPLGALFVALGAVMLLGILPTIALRDTR
ncbi:MAG TPA: MFS transporter [Candidatus Paceibacterota bacterium]|jgi:MFS family permease